MTKAQALSESRWSDHSEASRCPKCSWRMDKVCPIQGLSLLSERIRRCPKCRYIALSAEPVN